MFSVTRNALRKYPKCCANNPILSHIGKKMKFMGVMQFLMYTSKTHREVLKSISSRSLTGLALVTSLLSTLTTP
jgi:hypothetical protein